MEINRLKDAVCKAAKPLSKMYKLFDGGGLYLSVLPSGSKVWRQAYRFAGLQQTKTFGKYPEISLSAARTMSLELRSMLREEKDPMATRKAARVANAKPKMSLQSATIAYWQNRQDVSADYRKNALRGIEMHLYPALGEKDVSVIGRSDLLAALNPLNAEGKFVYVRRVLMWIDQVFEWAVENEFAAINPAKLINSRKAFGRKQVEHFNALSLSEVHEFFNRLSLEKDIQSVLACRLLALTWVRTAELRLMEWAEIDRAQSVWLLPAGKMKKRREHLVPLSNQALEIIDALQNRCRGSRFVFPANHRLDRPMSENAILYLIYRMGYKGRLTGHGFRSIASTWANENQFDKDAIERQLAHVPDNKVRDAYNRAEYLPIRQKMMQDFSDWVFFNSEKQF